jgi:hypothetical protein
MVQASALLPPIPRSHMAIADPTTTHDGHPTPFVRTPGASVAVCDARSCSVRREIGGGIARGPRSISSPARSPFQRPARGWSRFRAISNPSTH